MKKLWKKFDILTERCYSNMIGAGEEFQVWNEAFEVLLDIISAGREKNPDYAKELMDLDDSTDFSHDIEGWLEDYLDELEMRNQHDKLQKVCDKLLHLFSWVEDSPSDIRFRISSSLRAQEKTQEALDFCEKWYQEETDNLTAATALIYARLSVKDWKGAEELVEKYISEDTVCTEENDIVFTAASALYKANGDKKQERWVNRAIEQYDKELEAFCMGMDDEEDFDFDFPDEDFPFN